MQIVGNIKKGIEIREKDKKDKKKGDDDGDNSGSKKEMKKPSDWFKGTSIDKTSMMQGSSEAFIFGSNSGFHTDYLDEF